MIGSRTPCATNRSPLMDWFNFDAGFILGVVGVVRGDTLGDVLTSPWARRFKVLELARTCLRQDGGIRPVDVERQSAALIRRVRRDLTHIAAGRF